MLGPRIAIPEVGMPPEEDRDLKVVIKCLKLDKNAQLPRYAHPGDAGMDIFALESVVLLPGERKRIRTGIALELPEGTEAQVRPRSGLAFRHGITVLNSPGTVDSGYRGEVMVILINLGQAAFTVEAGMRIAQMVVKPVLTAGIQEACALNGTERGGGGFGSTG